MKVINEACLYEMANVNKEDTGLPYNLWIDSAGKDRNTSHNSPRLKVEVDGELIPVSISDNPTILVNNVKITKFNIIKRYIKKYKNVLLKHWNRVYTDRQTLLKLNKLSDSLDDEDK